MLGLAAEFAEGLPTALKYAWNTNVHHPMKPLNCTFENSTTPCEAALLVTDDRHSTGVAVLVIVKGSWWVTRLLPILNSTGWGSERRSRGVKWIESQKLPFWKTEKTNGKAKIAWYYKNQMSAKTCEVWGVIRENEICWPPMIVFGKLLTKITSLALIWRVSSGTDGFEAVHDWPAVTDPAVLEKVAINLSTQLPMKLEKKTLPWSPDAEE
jgi:hypothetical protein